MIGLDFAILIESTFSKEEQRDATTRYIPVNETSK
jgi:hypothetical protein